MRAADPCRGATRQLGAVDALGAQPLLALREQSSSVHSAPTLVEMPQQRFLERRPPSSADRDARRPVARAALRRRGRACRAGPP